MREIKFRVFNKLSREFKINPVNYVIDGEGNLFWIFGYNDPIFCSEPEYILDRYTGLKDKNSKEIYEGDIVKNQWGNEQVLFCYEKLNRLKIFSNVIEVIGNIHESPELLEKI